MLRALIAIVLACVPMSHAFAVAAMRPAAQPTTMPKPAALSQIQMKDEFM